MSWTGKNDLKKLDADFFENGRKEPPFSKISGYVLTGKNDLKTLRVDADFFENRRRGLRGSFQNVFIVLISPPPLTHTHTHKTLVKVQKL